MAQSPEELRQQIEQTRQDMSRNVEAIGDRVSPTRIVQRRVDRTKGAVGSLRERVMGTAHSTVGSAQSGMGSVGGRASNVQSSVSDAVTGAPDMAISRTQGNPLAAGLVAFAAGYLIAGLLPATKVEEQAAQTVEDKVKEPAKEHLAGVASDLKEGMQPSVQTAVANVKETATEGAQEVADQGKDSAQTVRDDAKGATEEVRSSSR